MKRAVLLGSIVLTWATISGCPSAPVETDSGLDAAERDAPAPSDVPGSDVPDTFVDLPPPPDAPPDAPPDLCGNSEPDPGEVCDDGNRVGGDGCRADCLGEEVCGDGLADVGEWCTTRTTVTSPFTGAPNGGPVLVDADEDGDLDIYLVLDAAVSFLEGRGDGTFEPPITAGPTDLGVFAQLDDAPGLEMMLAFGNQVRVFAANGDGTLDAPALIARTDASTIGASDVDGDGDADLVVGAFAGATCAVYLNDGTATFGAAIDFSCGTGATEIRQTLTGDVDGDGLGDAVFLHDLGMDNVTIAHATGAGVMSASAADSRFPARGAIGDLDGDGELDVMHAVMVFPLALMWVRTVDGAPQTPIAAIPTTAFGAGPQLIDADLDGDLDVYAFGVTSGTPFSFLMRNDGAGAFTELDTALGPGVILADLNGDDAIDVLSISGGSVTVALAQP